MHSSSPYVLSGMYFYIRETPVKAFAYSKYPITQRIDAIGIGIRTISKAAKYA